MPKLYNDAGENNDGAMTQAAVSEMAEIKSLLRTVNFTSSGSNQTSITLSSSFAAGDYVVEIDTPETDGVILTDVRFRNGTNNDTATHIRNVPLDGATHKYYITTGVTTTRVLLWSFSKTGSYGKLTIRVYRKLSDYSRLDSIPYDVSAYNNSEIYTLVEAISAIPSSKRQLGMMLKFINPNKKYSVYKYIGTSIGGITDKSYWRPVVGSEDELEGDLVINLQENYSMGEYRIIANESESNFGEAVSQSSSVWATPHIKCSGYDYLYVTLYPSSNSTFYNCGCVFYDVDGLPIKGYGSMAFEASSTNDGNPCYPFPRCLAIPQNAVTFRTTYRKNQYPGIKLISGEWDKIPVKARYSSTYYGTKIETRKAHKIYLTHWMRYSSGLSSNQAGCAYGDYLFLFGQQNYFSVVDFSDPTGPAKSPIQSNIQIPGMRLKDGQSVIHNDGVGFTDVFYDANDDFPLLVCGGGYADNATGTTYFYVVRVVKNDDGNGSITFTPTVIQEITVISGITTGTSGSCLNVFYDTDRHEIIVSGKGYTWVTKYNVSTSDGDITIDLTNTDSYKYRFCNSAGSGSYYNGYLFAANENNGTIGFKSLNVITGEYKKIALARHFEPEAVFAHNDQLYLLEVGSVFRLYFD